MNARKLFVIVMLLVLAISVIGCGTPVAVTPAAAPPPTVAVQPTTAPVAVLDVRAALEKYLSGLPDGFSLIQPAAVKDQMAATKVFVVDVRETADMANGFIEGSVNIPVRTVMKNLDKLPAKDQPIIITCASGHRGAFTMAALQMLGYTNVKSMAGGVNAWRTANLPLVKTGAPVAPMAGMAPTVDKDMLAAFDKWFGGLPEGFGTIAPTAAKDQMAATKVTVIDLREVSEIAANGYIENSVNIPIRSLLKSDKLPSDKATTIVVTCASGHRGSIAMMTLQMLGYTNVKSMAGGVNAWKAANLPLVGGPAAFERAARPIL